MLLCCVVLPCLLSRMLFAHTVHVHVHSLQYTYMYMYTCNLMHVVTADQARRGKVILY